MPGRKPRADSKLRTLPPDQRTALTDWLVEEGISYAEARERLAARYGVKTSLGAISDYWQTECFSLRYRAARSAADRIVETMREGDGATAFDEATLHAVGQRAFELAVARDADISGLTTLIKVIGDSAKLQIARERLEIDKRKVAVLEAKAAQADEAAAVTGDAKLTPEEKLARHRQIFGIG
jgi:hypothetical protein